MYNSNNNNKWASVVLVLLLFGSDQLPRINGEDQTITQQLGSTQDGQLFYVELGVGSRNEMTNARQTFKLLVSTTYFMTWIPSVALNPTRGYVNQTAGYRDFNCFLAKTGGRYAFLEYSVHNETCQIGSQVVGMQPFAVASPIGGNPRRRRDLFNDYGLDGMLGLSGYDGEPTGTYYLFRNLHRLGYIDKLQFSLYMNNTAAIGAANQMDQSTSSSSSAGALVLGGTDRRYFTGGFRYATLYNHLDQGSAMSMNKTLKISSIQLDWSRVNEQTRSRPEIQRIVEGDPQSRIRLTPREARLKLDSTTKLFIGPKKILNLIHLDFLGATRVGLRHFYVFEDCHLDNKPDIVFTVDEIEFIIKPDEYVMEDELDGRRVCVSAFLGHFYRNNWAFGTRFLRKYYTLFDYENQRVGFATPT